MARTIRGMEEVVIRLMASSIKKDRAWKRYKGLKNYIRDNQCTYTQMQVPTEHNVQKCMNEVKYTTRATKELKRIGRTLGEPTNTDRMRRPW